MKGAAVTVAPSTKRYRFTRRGLARIDADGDEEAQPFEEQREPDAGGAASGPSPLDTILRYLLIGLVAVVGLAVVGALVATAAGTSSTSSVSGDGDSSTAPDGTQPAPPPFPPPLPSVSATRLLS
eukprot:4601775-Prymnesium_polylepis.1